MKTIPSSALAGLPIEGFVDFLLGRGDLPFNIPDKDEKANHWLEGLGSSNRLKPARA